MKCRTVKIGIFQTLRIKSVVPCKPRQEKYPCTIIVPCAPLPIDSDSRSPWSLIWLSKPCQPRSIVYWMISGSFAYFCVILLQMPPPWSPLGSWYVSQWYLSYTPYHWRNLWNHCRNPWLYHHSYIYGQYFLGTYWTRFGTRPCSLSYPVNITFPCCFSLSRFAFHLYIFVCRR